jgi:type II secretory pathway pseudopilin PulG
MEMLIVVALIAILSSLTLPALQGLAGTSGLRGGVNTVLAALDQARAAAIENGTDVYVGFPPADFSDPNDPVTEFSSLIVFRGPRPDEPPDTFTPLSRWIRLPSGVLMVPDNITLTNLENSPEDTLPKLAGEKVNPVVIRYDRFGRVRNGVSGGTNITVGEAFVGGDAPKWKGENREFLSVQRLTGRWMATRP